MTRTWKRALVALVALAFTPEAQASEEFPGEIQDALNLACTPQCILCHIDNAGGYGRVDKAFGLGLRDELPIEVALVPEDPSSAAPAIEYARDNDLDFDDDGTPDIEELENGIYPSTDQRFCGEGAVSGPTYGCGARVAPRGGLDGLAASLAALVALGLLRGRRRR